MTINYSDTRLTRYIYIDPNTQTIETRVVHLDVAAMYSIIGCDSLDAARLPNGDGIWFDGEAVERGVPLNGFEISGMPVLGSRAMVMGPEHLGVELPGDCKMGEADAVAQIAWMPQRKIVGEKFVETPAGGVVSFVFEPAE